jgi:hypothetical protein
LAFRQGRGYLLLPLHPQVSFGSPEPARGIPIAPPLKNRRSFVPLTLLPSSRQRPARLPGLPPSANRPRSHPRPPPSRPRASPNCRNFKACTGRVNNGSAALRNRTGGWQLRVQLKRSLIHPTGNESQTRTAPGAPQIHRHPNNQSHHRVGSAAARRETASPSPW